MCVRIFEWDIFWRRALCLGYFIFLKTGMYAEKDNIGLGMGPNVWKAEGGSRASLGHSWILFPKLDSCQEICIFFVRVLKKIKLFLSIFFAIS